MLTHKKKPSPILISIAQICWCWAGKVSISPNDHGYTMTEFSRRKNYIAETSNVAFYDEHLPCKSKADLRYANEFNFESPPPPNQKTSFVSSVRVFFQIYRIDEKL